MLVLVDTSVWLQHLRRPLPSVVALLTTEDVVTHPVVIGEIAVGNLPDRARTLLSFERLLDLTAQPAAEVLSFVESRALFGRGLSWGDVQLLAAADFNAVPLWTLDKRLEQASQNLGLAWTP